MASISTLANPVAKSEIAEADSQLQRLLSPPCWPEFHGMLQAWVCPLHDLFQTIYEDHFEGQSTVAERIKAIGGHAEGAVAMVSRSKVNEHDGHARSRDVAAMVGAETLAETLPGPATLPHHMATS